MKKFFKFIFSLILIALFICVVAAAVLVILDLQERGIVNGEFANIIDLIRNYIKGILDWFINKLNVNI